MLAASRNESVIGRTRILRVSTKTRKGFNHLGAPPGRREAAAVDGEVATPEIMIPIHIGRPKDSLKSRWEVVLKMYGRIPLKFRIITMIKREARIEAEPFIWV